MTFGRSLLHIIIIVLSLFNLNIYSEQTPGNIKNVQVIPDNIEVGTFFNGLQVKVTAEIPYSNDVIVKLVGKEKEMELNKKGKKGIIWLNLSKVKVENAPSIYILSCTDRLEKICSDEEQEKEMLGYNSLKGRVAFKSDLPLTGIEFDEFIKLKEHSGYYNIDNKARIKSISDGKQFLEATLEIPSFISADDYNVVIYCFKDRNLIDKTIVKLSVEEVGLPLLITNLAKGSPAIYGILAIVVAMIAGGIIGLVFTKKRSNK
jgi:uncharacterized protein (TIGR02186 family)